MKKTGLEHFHFRMQGFAGNRILPLPPSLHSGPDPVCSSGQAGILVIPPEDVSVRRAGWMQIHTRD